MKIAVWDTYVPRSDGRLMHFDILVPSTLKDFRTIFSFGNEYLEGKTFETGNLSSNECKFCHIQKAPPLVVTAIKDKGYHIIEMENCH